MRKLLGYGMFVVAIIVLMCVSLFFRSSLLIDQVKDDQLRLLVSDSTPCPSNATVQPESKPSDDNDEELLKLQSRFNQLQFKFMQTAEALVREKEERAAEKEAFTGKSEAKKRLPTAVGERTFTRAEAQQCLQGHNILFLGNSVTRHLYFVLFSFLESGRAPHCGLHYRHQEKMACDSEDMAECTTEIAQENSENIKLRFVWQQRIHSKRVESLVLDQVGSNQGRRNILLMNAGLDDIALNGLTMINENRTQINTQQIAYNDPNAVWEHPEQSQWRQGLLKETPRMGQMFKTLFRRSPFARVVWRTTSALCGAEPGENYGMNRNEGNSRIAYSNEYIREELEAVQNSTLQGGNLRRWQEERLSELEEPERSEAPWMDGYTPSDALYVWEMFESTRKRCKEYDDRIHHCELTNREHLQHFLRQVCTNITARKGYPKDWPRRNKKNVQLVDKHGRRDALLRVHQANDTGEQLATNDDDPGATAAAQHRQEIAALKAQYGLVEEVFNDVIDPGATAAAQYQQDPEVETQIEDMEG